MKKIYRMIEAAEDWLDYTDVGAAAGVLILLIFLIAGWLALYMVAA